MRILLCQPIIEEYDSFPNTYPLGLLSIAMFLKRSGFNDTIKILVGTISRDDINEFKPDIIGISLLSAHFTIGCTLINEIRQDSSELPIIIGGQHITYLPENLPLHATAGIIGEGESPFFELCQAFRSSRCVTRDMLEKIPNTIFRVDGKLHFSAQPHWLLDESEFPLIDCFDLCTFSSKKPVSFHLLTSRGCPYKCRFCSSSPFWKKIRYQSAEKTVAQIHLLVSRFSPEVISISDDLLLVNKTKLSEIKDLVVQNGLHKKTSFFCWASGNTFNASLGATLRAMNVRSLCFAVESASPRIYQYLKGTWNNPDNNFTAIQLASRMGFSVTISCIVGSPQETAEEMTMTYRFLKKLRFNGGSVALLKPYPGTVLWQEALDRGIVTNDMIDWSVIERNDLLDPKTLYLGLSTSREETHRQYMKIKKMLKQKQLAGLLMKMMSPSNFLWNCKKAKLRIVSRLGRLTQNQGR
jgi:radical SAM superfamily enzyme YgiQ (UPF0313 family)